MQHRSSKINEQLLRASELFDGQCRHCVDDVAIITSYEVKEHLKQWSIIGSALRNELPSKIDLNFADKVMAKIEQDNKASISLNESEDALPSLLRGKNFAQLVANEPHDEKALYPGPQVDPEEDSLNNVEPTKAQATQATQAQVTQAIRRAPKFLNLKRVYTFGSQIAIAASVAVVAIVGVQTYNASQVASEPTVTANVVKPVTMPAKGLSLASYQNNENDLMVNIDQSQINNQEAKKSVQSLEAELKRKQNAELELINQYVQGYVLDTASNN